MRTTILLFMTTFFLGYQNNQKQNAEMNDTIEIQETITKLFVHTDNRNWKGVEEQFGDKVTLNYSSMTGNPASEISPTTITTGWKTVLPGFDKTHHQIGNFITQIDGNKASSFCYGTATHYLEDENGNVWIVVGSYNFNLEKIENDWKIKTMTFNYKYQDGNRDLIEKVMENVKSK